MKINVLYIDENEAYRRNLVNYITRNNSENIDITSMEISAYSEAFAGKSYDIYVLTDVSSRYMNNIPFAKTVILSDANDSNAERRIFRYQPLTVVVSKIYEAYGDGVDESEILELKKLIVDRYDLAKLSDDGLMEKIRFEVEKRLENRYVNDGTVESMCKKVFSTIRGLGVLDTILEDEDVTEVMINDYDCIFVERAGRIERYKGACFESRENLGDTIQKIVGRANKEVNSMKPTLDTRLADGSRVNIVLPPIALNGPTMTIRRFPKEPMTMEKLVGYGSITPDIVEVLKLFVKARYNIFVCGGTGSGKTTFLNALSNFIPKDERIITIEDSAELQIVGIDNLVSMETRISNSTGAGEINMRDLIKTSLRMRPDRIVVGEVRGAEALDMLQAMNTGHDGSLSTGHANSTEDMLSRLETMVLQGSAGLPLEAIKQQIGSAVDIIIHLSRMRDHSRKTLEITEVVGYEDGEIVLNPLYTFAESESSTRDHVVGQLVRTANPLRNYEKLYMAGYDVVI